MTGRRSAMAALALLALASVRLAAQVTPYPPANSPARTPSPTAAHSAT